MSNKKTDTVVANIAFFAPALIYVEFYIEILLGKQILLESNTSGIIGFVIIPSLLLLNAILCCKPKCAGWWGIIKGVISFGYLAEVVFE